MYFPRALQSMSRLTAGKSCRAMRHLQVTEKLMFWLRDHGSLDVRTVAAAMKAGTPAAKVVRLAEAWARERIGASGHNDGDLNDGLQCRS